MYVQQLAEDRAAGAAQAGAVRNVPGGGVAAGGRARWDGPGGRRIFPDPSNFFEPTLSSNAIQDEGSQNLAFFAERGAGQGARAGAPRARPGAGAWRSTSAPRRSCTSIVAVGAHHGGAHAGGAAPVRAGVHGAPHPAAAAVGGVTRQRRGAAPASLPRGRRRSDVRGALGPRMGRAMRQVLARAGAAGWPGPRWWCVVVTHAVVRGDRGAAGRSGAPAGGAAGVTGRTWRTRAAPTSSTEPPLDRYVRFWARLVHRRAARSIEPEGPASTGAAARWRSGCTSTWASASITENPVVDLLAAPRFPGRWSCGLAAFLVQALLGVGPRGCWRRAGAAAAGTKRRWAPTALGDERAGVPCRAAASVCTLRIGCACCPTTATATTTAEQLRSVVLPAITLGVLGIAPVRPAHPRRGHGGAGPGLRARRRGPRGRRRARVLFRARAAGSGGADRDGGARWTWGRMVGRRHRDREDVPLAGRGADGGRRGAEPRRLGDHRAWCCSPRPRWRCRRCCSTWSCRSWTPGSRGVRSPRRLQLLPERAPAYCESERHSAARSLPGGARVRALPERGLRVLAELHLASCQPRICHAFALFGDELVYWTARS